MGCLAILFTIETCTAQNKLIGRYWYNIRDIHKRQSNDEGANDQYLHLTRSIICATWVRHKDKHRTQMLTLDSYLQKLASYINQAATRKCNNSVKTASPTTVLDGKAKWCYGKMDERKNAEDSKMLKSTRESASGRWGQKNKRVMHSSVTSRFLSLMCQDYIYLLQDFLHAGGFCVGWTPNQEPNMVSSWTLASRNKVVWSNGTHCAPISYRKLLVGPGKITRLGVLSVYSPPSESIHPRKEGGNEHSSVSIPRCSSRVSGCAQCQGAIVFVATMCWRDGQARLMKGSGWSLLRAVGLSARW